LLADAGLSLFNQPIQEHLAELEKELEARIIEVNQRIESGENKHIQVKKRGSHSRWTLPILVTVSQRIIPFSRH
jgi:hypothetical protein